MLTHARLKTLLRYNKRTGVFTWRVTTSSKSMVGNVAGYMRKDGYVSIMINWKRYLVHRLAWLYVNGRWPKNHIDHKDGRPWNNRWNNLRDVTRCENQQNRRCAAKQNKLGILGVRSQGKKFSARIVCDGHEIYLGTFDTAKAASRVYLQTKRELHRGCMI